MQYVKILLLSLSVFALVACGGGASSGAGGGQKFLVSLFNECVTGNWFVDGRGPVNERPVVANPQPPRSSFHTEEVTAGVHTFELRAQNGTSVWSRGINVQSNREVTAQCAF